MLEILFLVIQKVPNEIRLLFYDVLTILMRLLLLKPIAVLLFLF